ncbi:MAG: hypothetical protein IKS07_00380 [Lachnospiraceae bacterium]|nr:hypothetical protein [Lachnospiraceae bacterium]
MEELKLQVSGVFEKNGKKQACISFSGGGCYAEGVIPECVLTKSEGFTPEQVTQLEDFLRANLTDLKRRAARIDPIGAFLGKQPEGVPLQTPSRKPEAQEAQHPNGNPAGAVSLEIEEH